MTERCEEHGLTFDSAAAEGCVLCRRGANACPSCKRPVADDVAACPYCGASQAKAVTALPGARSPLQKRLPMYAAIAGGVLGASIVFNALGREECRGGGSPDIEWIASPDEAPRHRGDVYHVPDLDPLPHIELAYVRHIGNETYANKTDALHGHVHEPVVQAMREVGANVFVNEPSQPIGEGRYEVVSVAALAHAGWASAAQRREHFRGGRACLVTQVAADSAAEAGDLRAGDVFVAINGESTASRRPCKASQAAMTNAPRGSDVEVALLRNGDEVAVVLERPSKGLYGYYYADVPVLEDAP